MWTGNRDTGLTGIRSRKQHRCYGMGLGVMLVDDVYPGFPGDMRNASAYPFPVQYDIVRGIGFDDLIFAEDKSACVGPIVEAARRLQDMGCRAIAAECGYFAYFQREVADAVDVPVFMSSLLQAPLARTVVGAHRSVGLMVAFRDHLTDAHLRAVGIDPAADHPLAGIAESGLCPTLVRLYDEPDPALREASYEVVEHEVVTLARQFRERHPRMGAMVLECGAVQPFARAVQRHIDIPVFSWGTLLDYAYGVVAHRDYYGHV
ncbi:aspartate/glutamate racemase family protein [Streptomyces coeruleoprunus]|uniref:Aspartate/glutamate racemase family protein n=1 Tax=Streptomyces coeruleoprunus TaxID=285563 RepID=A0ABV9XGT0_9ACTN